MQKIKKNTLDINLLKSQLLELNKHIKDIYTALETTEIEKEDIYIKQPVFKLQDAIIDGISVKKEIIKHAQKLHDQNNGYIKVLNFYQSFANYMHNTHNIDITDKTNTDTYIAPQKLGRITSSINTSGLPFTIIHGRESVGHYRIIKSK